MACICCCLYKCIQLFIIYIYPGYKVIQTFQKNDLQKMWIIYFLILGLFTICEQTLLLPIIFILGKLCRTIFPTLKILFHLWLYYPEYRGALLLEQKNGDLINKIYLKLNPIVGKVFTFVGIPNRVDLNFRKKEE